MLKVVHDTKIVDENTAGESLLAAAVRVGAQQILGVSLQLECYAYGDAHSGEVGQYGRQFVVRIHYHEPLQVTTVAGAVSVHQPRSVDKRTDDTTGKPRRFVSAILPAWARKSPQVSEELPLLYLPGLSSDNFAPAAQFLGSTAGLSPTTITRMYGKVKPQASTKAHLPTPPT